MSTYENPWLYQGTEFNGEGAEAYVGFVYLITNKTNNRKYVGKKNLWTPKTTYVKNPKTDKKKKVKSKIESNWKEYYGSNKELQADIESLGKENFQREILHFCITAGNLSFLELKEQIVREALELPEYYNSYIIVRVNKNHLKPQAGLNISVPVKKE